MSIGIPNGIIKNKELKSYSTWRVGGEAEFFCQPHTQDQLLEFFLWASSKKLNMTVIGGGSNLLISDRGMDGLVISTRDFNYISPPVVSNTNLIIEAQAGAKKSDLLKIFLKHQLAPALFLAGLPGDVAGGVVMNAGVSESICPREFFEIVDSIEVARFIDGKIKIIHIHSSQINWEYRHSSGWQPGIILSVKITWPLTIDKDIKDKVRLANQNRLLKQPLKQPSCGSTFRNPSKEISAGMLIDKSGLKGFRIGGAQVSTKHANFIVTDEMASANDVENVIRHVQKIVFEKFQIQLQTEIVRVGRW